MLAAQRWPLYVDRTAFKLNEKGYLRKMLSRRQLQGFVGRRRCNHPGNGNSLLHIILEISSLILTKCNLSTTQ